VVVIRGCLQGVVISGGHPVLSSGVFIRYCYPVFSSGVVIYGCHLGLSPDRFCCTVPLSMLYLLYKELSLLKFFCF
jgi:hypothetical protein